MTELCIFINTIPVQLFVIWIKNAILLIAHVHVHVFVHIIFIFKLHHFVADTRGNLKDFTFLCNTTLLLIDQYNKLTRKNIHVYYKVLVNSNFTTL